LDYRKKLIVEPGSKIKLSVIVPSFHGRHETHEAALDELQKCVARLTHLQHLLYAERKHALLIVLQGIDAAGKDGTCWHVMTAMNPQGTTVTGFKQPTEEERSHDFLWRIHPHTPGLGRVAVTSFAKGDESISPIMRAYADLYSATLFGLDQTGASRGEARTAR